MWLNGMCINDCPFKWAIFRSSIPPTQPLLWRGLLRGGLLLPSAHLFICKISKFNGTCAKIFTQRLEFIMLSGLKKMYKPHCHRIAFIDDLGSGLKVKFWCILKKKGAKHWKLAFYILSFVKRWITIIYQRESSLFFLWETLWFRFWNPRALLINTSVLNLVLWMACCAIFQSVSIMQPSTSLRLILKF